MSITKICFKCGLEKPLSEFYVHKPMKDGHLNKCKECVKAYARSPEYREKARHRDNARAKQPKRKAQMIEAQRRRRTKFPDKAKAWRAVSYGKRNGHVESQPCIICGNPKAEAHHEDYSKPLEVDWLCFKHHRAYHAGKFQLLKQTA